MKFVIGLIVLAGTAMALGLYTVRGQLVVDQAQEFFNEANTLEVRVAGVVSIDPIEIRSLAPIQRSVVWWNLNESAVEKAVLRHPAVAKVKVSRCEEGVRKPGCFLLTVTERLPAFIAELGDELWLVAKDGGFIRPIRDLAAVAELDAQGKERPRIMRGLFSRTMSPDVIKARVAFGLQAVQAIEKSTGRHVSAIEFRPNGELDAQFGDLTFPVTFDGADADALASQGKRFAALISSFSGDLRSIERVDLAFHKLGVVKLKAGVK